MGKDNRMGADCGNGCDISRIYGIYVEGEVEKQHVEKRV